MIRKMLLAGFVAIGLLCDHASVLNHKMTLRLQDSDFHRYPARVLFTSDGNLLVAYRTAQPNAQSSRLEVAEFEGKTGRQIAKHSYAVPSAGPVKISDGFVISRDGHSLYYVELTGNPVILEISTSTLDILSESTSNVFSASDFMPRVERATDDALFLSAASRLPGKAVHLVALSRNDVSKAILDEQIPARPDWGQSYKLSYGADSLWMGSGKYWLKIGIKSGQVEAKLTAQNDLDGLTVISNGVIGMTNLASAGSLQLFDSTGHQIRTLEQPGCGFVSAQVSLDERYGSGICQRTGTTEWSFGKTLERNAVIFDTQTMVATTTLPLSKMSLKTSSGTDDARIWYPQPTVWSSDKLILLAMPDFSGTISLEERAIPGKVSPWQ